MESEITIWVIMRRVLSPHTITSHSHVLPGGLINETGWKRSFNTATWIHCQTHNKENKENEKSAQEQILIFDEVVCGFRWQREGAVCLAGRSSENPTTACIEDVSKLSLQEYLAPLRHTEGWGQSHKHECTQTFAAGRPDILHSCSSCPASLALAN